MNSKKLLIVDDEPGIRESLQEYLEFEGFNVSVASCGEEALVLVRDNSFDLIISDIRMPHGDGKFLVQKLRERDLLNPPVLFMSGFTDMSVEEAYHIGARGILSKPFQPQDLISRIQSLMKNLGAPTSQDQEFIDIKIPTKNIESAVSQKKLNCGQYGLFISAEDLMPSVGDRVRIEFEDQSLLGDGVVRWIRAYERIGQVKGFGLELMKTSEHLGKAIEAYVQENRVLSVIPINLKD